MDKEKRLYEVVLIHTVKAVIAAESREEVEDWLNTTTPKEAVERAKAEGHYVSEDYSEDVLKEIKDKSNVADIDLAKRQISLTGSELSCCDEIIFTEDGLLEFTWELWFDVDKYFGTDTKNKDATWINFYTYLHNDGDITAKFFIDGPHCTETHDWPLTHEEKKLLAAKMQKHCSRRHNESMLGMLSRMQKEYMDDESRSITTSPTK